jgi:hypothetical protein
MNTYPLCSTTSLISNYREFTGRGDWLATTLRVIAFNILFEQLAAGSHTKSQ